MAPFHDNIFQQRRGFAKTVPLETETVGLASETIYKSKNMTGVTSTGAWEKFGDATTTEIKLTVKTATTI